MNPWRATACLILLLASPAFPAPIPVGGQVSPPVKDARAVLVPVVSELEAGKLDLQGKADPEPVASAAVAADGSFRLEAPEPGMYRVLVQAPGFVPRELALQPLLEETDLPAVELEKDARIEVRVTGPDGKPLPGARVRIGDRPQGRPAWRVPVRAGMTGADGKILLPRGAAEGVTVRAGAPGLPYVERRDVRTSSLTLGLPAGTARDIRVMRVMDAAGKPAAGVLVRLGEPRWAAGLTSADGLLTVPFAPKQRLRVVATAEDGRSASAWVEPLRPGESGPRVLRLPAFETLAGRVTSAADGRPVAGAVVWAEDPGAFRRTGADGAYKLTAAAGGELPLQAVAAGFFRGESKWPVKAGERRAPTLALEPAFAAAGVVVDEQGKPVAGVEIKAAIQPGSRVRTMARWQSGGTARTSTAGRFRITTLAAGLGHQLRLTKKGYAPLTADVPPLESGGGDLRLVLRRGRTGFGRVVNQAEQPVAGAKVLLERELPADLLLRMSLSGDTSGRFETASGADGRFEIPDLPPGAFQLTAGGAGYAPITVPGLAVAASGIGGTGGIDLGTVVLVRGVALEGYVTDPQGKPVEGAQVSVAESSGDPLMGLRRADGSSTEPAAITAADGFFRVADRRAGETLDVEVRRAGYGPGNAPGVQVPSAEPVRIVLRPSSAVEGRTVDPDGKPVAGAAVLINPAAPTAMGRGFVMFSSASMKETRSGDDGSFRIEDVSPGTWDLKATASGRQSADMSSVEVRSAQDTRVDVVLPPGAFVEGRVLSPGSRPVAGAEIELVEPRTGGSRMILRPTRTASDGDGFFRLDGVSPGARTFQAEREGFRTAIRDLEVQPGENTLDFNLDAGAEVSGRVVDDDGTPVPAARVVLHEGYESWNLPSAVTRPDGSFTLSGVADGTYRITAEKEGYAETRGQDLTVAGSVSGVEVRLSTGGAIVGQLSGLDFTELAQAQVWVDDELHQGRVLSDGTYRVDHVEPGEHRVFASLRGERQTDGRVTLEPDAREVRLDLELGGGYLLAGRVLRNGEPVRGENVALGGPGVPGRWAKTDHEGRFRFEGLEAGTYDLTVIDSRGQAHHKETVELSHDAEVELDLLSVTLTGRVLDSSDKLPLAGVRVALLPPRGGEVGSFLRLEAVTDARGAFRLPDVPGGSWRVQAVLEGYTPGEQTLDVSASLAADELEIALQATDGVTVQVALASGRAPNYVRAAVLDGSGQEAASGTYPTGEDGRLHIGIVPAGSWDLVLDADGAAPVTLPVTAPGNAGRVVLPLPGVLDLKVPALFTARVGARVTLTGENGKPFRTAWGGSLNSFELEAGALKLDRLAPGTWKLDVAADDGRTWSGTATVVPGGTVQVTLD